MEPYAEINIKNVTNSHELSCVVNNTSLTPLKWLMFKDELKKKLQTIGDDPSIKKFYMYYDATFLDLMIQPEKYKELSQIFIENYELFKDKLLGTFIYVESHVLNLMINIFIKFYSPVRPLFILKTKSIDPNIINDLLDNRKNENEYNINK